MKPEYRNHWDKDDEELAEAFQDVASAWHTEKTPVPPVPPGLEREIKRLAHYDAGESLQKNWLLGNGPQVALAASIFFAVGLYFIIGLEPERVNLIWTVISKITSISHSPRRPALGS